MPRQPSLLEVPDLGRPLTSLPALLTGSEGPESFASHVDRVAAYQVLPLPITSLLARAGVIAVDRFDALPTGYGVDMSDDLVSGFARVLDLSELAVRAMLLRSLNGYAFDLTGLNVNDFRSILTVAQREWAGFRGSACCPGCLDETGGWRLRWKLWFSFACLTHRALLVDRCPRCQCRTGNYREYGGIRPSFPGLVPKPGFCGNPLAVGVAARGRAGRPCGQNLGEVQTIRLDNAFRLLKAQRLIYTALEAGQATVAGKEVPSLTYFAQLRALMALVLFIGEPDDLGVLPPEIYEAVRLAFQKRDKDRESFRGQVRVYQPYRSPPSDVRLIAAVLPLACELLAQPDRAAVAMALRPFISRFQSSRRIDGNSAVRRMGRYLHFQGALADGLNDIMAKTANFDRTVGHLSGEQAGKYVDFLPDHVPALLWLDVYRQNFAPLLEGLAIGEATARATISMALVKLCGKYSWAESLAILDLAEFRTKHNSCRIITHLKKQERIETFQQALHHLAAQLSQQEAPTNYRARRRALEHFYVIPPDRWKVISSGAGFKEGEVERLRRNGAAWVWTQLTGGDYRLSPALSRDPERQTALRKQYRKFERDVVPLLEVQLRLLVEEMEREL